MTKEEFLKKFKHYLDSALNDKVFTSFTLNLALIVVFHLGLILVSQVIIDKYFCGLRRGQEDVYIRRIMNR